ncbi:hypothetical protein A500_17405 [Clostridium sartagoforme AAU1]|uniref:Uncharacterized protein n=1 Tax=Clostridium sartagoforme AAU1 TaxID=1202534 RepID=R9BTA1_9CLOT|nr:hypothetical protein [Clostridium sartagoforme]EOR20339.1 hypothetical protein A500_17405 [Clostridium sartagoforme AAU1]
MSSCRENRTRKIKKQSNIELKSIITFVKFIQSISFGMLGISILGLILVGKDPAAQVLYVMVIIVNLVLIFGGMVPIRYLNNKSK